MLIKDYLDYFTTCLYHKDSCPLVSRRSGIRSSRAWDWFGIIKLHSQSCIVSIKWSRFTYFSCYSVSFQHHELPTVCKIRDFFVTLDIFILLLLWIPSVLPPRGLRDNYMTADQITWLQVCLGELCFLRLITFSTWLSGVSSLRSFMLTMW